jgi:ABC-type dipeptide/oligopeptide/nickel transport system ATPase subunit
MDESLSALDTPTAISILKWLKQIQDDRNLTLLIISHDLRILLSICDKIEIMSAGRLVDQIEPGEIKNKFNSSVTKRLFKTYNI